MTTREPQLSTTTNVEYDLASVVYHKLAAAMSTFIHVNDAQWSGDQELTQFFLNNYQEERRMADRAEQLLSARLSQQQAQQGQQSQQAQFAQGQGQFGQGQFGQGQFGQGQYPDPRMYGGYGQGMYGGYGSGSSMFGGPGMYGGSNMYGGGYSSGPGMFGGMGGGMGSGMYGRGYGQGMSGGGMGGGMGSGMYGGQFGGNQFGGDQSGMPDLRQITGTSDVTFDLIRTIYHASRGAQTAHAFVQDAKDTGDQELTQFFQQFLDESNRCAEQAKRLLAPRLSYKKMRQGYYGGQYSSQAGQPVGAGTTGRTPTGGSDTATRR